MKHLVLVVLLTFDAFSDPLVANQEYVRSAFKSSQYKPNTAIGFYTGKTCDFINIDHVVSLKDAYESGASSWGASKKKTFANDTSNHVPSCGRVNSSKGSEGPSDFLRMNDFPSKINHDGADSPESRFIGAPIQKNPQKTLRSNPAAYASEGDPPFLHLHGDKDQLVPFNQSEILHAALKASGVETTLYKVVGGGHGFGGARESREELIEKSIRFFDSKLQLKSP